MGWRTLQPVVVQECETMRLFVRLFVKIVRQFVRPCVRLYQFACSFIYAIFVVLYVRPGLNITHSEYTSASCTYLPVHTSRPGFSARDDVSC